MKNNFSSGFKVMWVTSLLILHAIGSIALSVVNFSLTTNGKKKNREISEV